MKLRKLSALLLTLCCAMTLGSCKVTETATTTTAVPGKNTIQPAVLTQEESDLLELLDVQQPMLFDFRSRALPAIGWRSSPCRTAPGSRQAEAPALSMSLISGGGLH